jgi:hypothetical protein
MPNYDDYNYNIYYHDKSITYAQNTKNTRNHHASQIIQNCTPKTQKTAENSRNALKNVDLAHRTKLYQKKTKSTKLYRKRLTWCKFVGK